MGVSQKHSGFNNRRHEKKIIKLTSWLVTIKLLKQIEELSC